MEKLWPELTVFPLTVPYLTGRERTYIEEALQSRKLAGDGPFARRCQALMQERFGATSAQLTTSCTSALEVAALLCDFAADDEVIMPSYTFVSTANAFWLRQAKVKFVDIRRDTLNIDEAQIEAAMGPRTRAIVPVHYAGIGCEMDAIMTIAAKHDLIVIEDAAQGVNATYKGRFLGTIGDIGCYSFHESKNFVAGEAGAFLTNNPSFARRAEIVREKGTNRSQFFRGEVDKYTWMDVGSSYIVSDLLAAMLLAQLEAMDEITRLRRRVYGRYAARHWRPWSRRERSKSSRSRNTAPVISICFTCWSRTCAPERGSLSTSSSAAFTRCFTTCRCTPRRSAYRWATAPECFPSLNPAPTGWCGCRFTRT